MGLRTALDAPAPTRMGTRSRALLARHGTARDGIRHWTINGDFLGLKATGVARFGRELTAALDRLVGEQHPLTQDVALELVAPCRPAGPWCLDHIPLKLVPEFRMRLPQVWVQLQLPGHVRGGLLSFCNLAPVLPASHIVCIHDLQTRTTPESYGTLFRLLHRALLPALGRRATAVTTVSEFSKRDIVRFGIAPAPKVNVVHNGSDHARRWAMGAARAPWRSRRPYVMCIGRDEVHKNMELVWRLAEPLDALGIDIVIVGDFDVLACIPPGDGLRRNMRCLGRVDDDELSRGFTEALCFLFPSRTEGFGLPAIEAMACGCPVVASTAACLPEICGDGALFADPDDPDMWVQAIRRLLQQPGDRDRLRQRGLAQSARYSWRETALRYLELMRRIDDDAR